MTNRGEQLTDERSPLLANNRQQDLSAGNTGIMGRTDYAEETGGIGHFKAAARQEKLLKKNLNLRYDYNEYFVYSQCLPAWLMLLLRCIMGGVCVSVFLYMSITQPYVNFIVANTTDTGDNGTTHRPPIFKRHFYLCYLTIWSYLVITVYFITALVNTLSMWLASRDPIRDSSYVQPFSLTTAGFRSTENLLGVRGEAETASRGDSAGRQAGLRLQWLLCGVAANAALIVTGAYFGVLYPMIQRFNPGPVSPLDLLVHGFNSVFMFIEVVFSGVPVRLVHALYTALYGLIYTLFSILYWLPDHTNVIYPVLLDWNHAGLTIGIMCLLIFVGLPLVQLIWWLVYLARCYLAGTIMSREVGWSPGLNI